MAEHQTIAESVPAAMAEAPEFRWCRHCGIPHALEAAYCSHCGMPLDEDPLAAGRSAAPPAATTRAAQPAPVASPQLTPNLVPGQELRPAGMLSQRLRRSRSLSDTEIEAAAAAIVSQAQLLPDPDNALPIVPPLPDKDAEALRMTERDRFWLTAGLICCILLIVVAIAFTRFLNTAPVPH